MHFTTQRAALALMAGPAPAQVAGLVPPGLTVFGAARTERGLPETPTPASVIDSNTGLRRQPATHARIIGGDPAPIGWSRFSVDA